MIAYTNTKGKRIMGEAKVIKKLMQNKKLMLLVSIAGVLLLALLIFLFFRKMADPKPKDMSSTADSEISSESSTESSSASSMPEVPVKPVTVEGTNINRANLCIVIPANAGIKDPNVPAGKARTNKPIAAFSSGNRTSVDLRYMDNTLALESTQVLCLQAYDIGETPPEYVTYGVEAESNRKQQFTYEEIADKIVYNANGQLVLDVTFAKSKTPRSVMEERIALRSGKPLEAQKDTVLTADHRLADGTYIYKYDWMPPAFDYVSTHIKEMVVPTRYITSYSLDELGYTFQLNAAPGGLPHFAAVSSSTVKAEGDNVHSGLYKAAVYGGERLVGNYTVLQPSYGADSGTPNNPTSFALLQAFKRADLEPQDVCIRFLRKDTPKNASEDYYAIYTDGPFSEFSMAPEMLQNYIVYSDDSIVVYDFFEFSKAPVLEEQLKRLSETEGYEQYGIKTAGVAQARHALLEAEGGLGKYIHKK